MSAPSELQRLYFPPHNISCLDQVKISKNPRKKKKMNDLESLCTQFSKLDAAVVSDVYEACGKNMSDTALKLRGLCLAAEKEEPAVKPVKQTPRSPPAAPVVGVKKPVSGKQILTLLKRGSVAEKMSASEKQKETGALIERIRVGDMVTCAVHGKRRNISVMQTLPSENNDEAPQYRCIEGHFCIVHEQKNRASCDLCNEAIDETSLDEHYEKQHGPMIRWVQLKLEKASLTDGSSVPLSAMTCIGCKAREAAMKVDGGPDSWSIPTAAREQLELAARTVCPSATLFVFGSSSTLGTWNGTSDVDVTLVDPRKVSDQAWPPSDEPKLIRKLCAALRDAGFAFEDLEPIVHTRVPLVKRDKDELIPPVPEKFRNVECRKIVYNFNKAIKKDQIAKVEAIIERGNGLNWLDSRSVSKTCTDTTKAVQEMTQVSTTLRALSSILPDNRAHAHWCSREYRPEMFSISFDLSLRVHGIRNSQLLHRYMRQNPYIRVGYIFVKEWSKRTGVNNPKRGFLTSYAVSILWIYYSLQCKLAEYIPVESIPEIPRPEDATPSYQPMLSEEDKSDFAAFDVKMGNILSGFFRFYASMFNWERNVISINTPEEVPKKRYGWIQEKEIAGDGVKFKDRVWYRGCIEDPYEDNLNLGRHLSPIKLKKIHAEFCHAWQSLLEDNITTIMRCRTPIALEVHVNTLFTRCMINVTSYQIDALVQKVEEGDLDSLAAVLSDISLSKLLRNCALDYEKDAGSVRLRHKNLIPAVAEELCQVLEQKLAAAGSCGVQATREHKEARLTEYSFWLYEKGVDRFFASEHDSELFFRHVDAVKASLKRKARGLEHLQSSLNSRLVDKYESAVLDTIINETKYVELVMENGENRYCLRENAYQKLLPNKSEAISVRDTSKKLMGQCTECETKNVEVFPATDPKADEGKYCMKCWEAYT